MFSNRVLKNIVSWVFKYATAPDSDYTTVVRLKRGRRVIGLVNQLISILTAVKKKERTSVATPTQCGLRKN